MPFVLFLVFGYWVVQKILFLFHLNEKHQGGSVYFCTMDLEKGCIRTNMHTTVLAANYHRMSW